jgi:hypothetical protein
VCLVDLSLYLGLEPAGLWTPKIDTHNANAASPRKCLYLTIKRRHRRGQMPVRKGGVRLWTPYGHPIRPASIQIKGSLSGDGNVANCGRISRRWRCGRRISIYPQWRYLDATEKVVSAGAVGTFLPSVALSADGSVVLLGGANDNGGAGAAWLAPPLRDSHFFQMRSI